MREAGAWTEISTEVLEMLASRVKVISQTELVFVDDLISQLIGQTPDVLSEEVSMDTVMHMMTTKHHH